MSDAMFERYAAIERLYSQGQWAEVLQGSTALLGELPAEPGEPLRTRLLLLQAHTHLYGLGEIAKAAAIYEQVLADQPEPMLQGIAQQELARCQESLAATASAAATSSASPTASDNPSSAGCEPAVPPAAATPLSADFPFVPQAVGSAPSGQGVSAMPWLEAMGGVDPARQPAADPSPEPLSPEPEQKTDPAPKAPDGEPIPTVIQTASVLEAADVIEEPEQIEVRLADLKQAETLDLEPVTDLELMTPPPAQKPPWSPAEEAELAKGLLTVVLG